MLRGRVRRVGPEDELTLVEHLDELRPRLIVTVATLTVAIAACFWKSEQILHFLRGPIDDRQFIALSPRSTRSWRRSRSRSTAAS